MVYSLFRKVKRVCEEKNADEYLFSYEGKQASNSDDPDLPFYLSCFAALSNVHMFTESSIEFQNDQDIITSFVVSKGNLANDFFPLKQPSVYCCADKRRKNVDSGQKAKIMNDFKAHILKKILNDEKAEFEELLDNLDQETVLNLTYRFINFIIAKFKKAPSPSPFCLHPKTQPGMDFYQVDLVLFLLNKCKKLTEENDSTCLHLFGVVYICLGHGGNIIELIRTIENYHILDYGISPPPFTLLFTGNYTDFGKNSCESVLLLSLLKVLYPRNVFLLRGKQEDRAFNADISVLGTNSLFRSCRECFISGVQISETELENFVSPVLRHRRVITRFLDGMKKSNFLMVWESMNLIFDRLGFSAIIYNDEKDLFVTHGGLPRELSTYTRDSFLSAISHQSLPMSSFVKSSVLRDLVYSSPLRLTTKFPFHHDLFNDTNVKYSTIAVDLLKKLGFSRLITKNEGIQEMIEEEKEESKK